MTNAFRTEFPLTVLKTLAGDMIGHYDAAEHTVYRPRMMIPQRISQTQMGLALMDVFGPFLEGTDKVRINPNTVICTVTVTANQKLVEEYRSATSPIKTAPLLGGSY